MKLDKAQIAQLHAALLDGYDPAELRILLRTQLDQDLDEIVPEGTLRERVFSLIEWAERNECVFELIDGAHADLPQNAAIQQVWTASQQWRQEPAESSLADSEPRPPAPVKNGESTSLDQRRTAAFWLVLVGAAILVGAGGFYAVERLMLPALSPAPAAATINLPPLADAMTPTSAQATETSLPETPTQAAMMPTAAQATETAPPDAWTPEEMTPTAAPTIEISPPDASIPVAGAIRWNPTDGAAYVYVPAGPFSMGSAVEDAAAGNNEKPQATVTTDDYWIMRTEATNAQYNKCVEAGGCRKPPNDRWNDPVYADQPVTDVTWQQAREYAGWVGGRLPTEVEWEKACRGADGRIYPWGGSVPTANLANFDNNVGDTTVVGRYSPQGDSPYGLVDMAGNVWEWTSSRYALYPYNPADGREDDSSDSSARGARRRVELQ